MIALRSEQRYDKRSGRVVRDRTTLYMKEYFEVGGHAVTVTGSMLRVMRLRDEYYDSIQEPEDFTALLKSCDGGKGNIFTFLQEVPDRTPRFSYHLEWDSAAVLSLSTYEHWWKRQINDKTRNMVRKAQKTGVKIHVIDFSDELVRGIARIYNESPTRQGRRFRHFGKPFEILKSEHATFLDRSEFLGAYYHGELVGFVKLVHGRGVSNLMHIIGMNAHRDKAVTNALIAKSVERCAEREIPLLHYGMWSRRNMGSFKMHHAFERMEIPRYYIPLNAVGDLLLRCRLHRDIKSRIPEPWIDHLAIWRTKWNGIRYSRFPRIASIGHGAHG